MLLTGRSVNTLVRSHSPVNVKSRQTDGTLHMGGTIHMGGTLMSWPSLPIPCLGYADIRIS